MPSSLYLPDELKDRLLKAAQSAGFNVVKAGPGGEIPAFIEKLLNEYESANRTGLALDLRHPGAPMFRWNGARIESLLLRGPEGAIGNINAFGSGGGDKMSQALYDAKKLAGDYVKKARLMGQEILPVDIIALLELAGWEVFPE